MKEHRDPRVNWELGWKAIRLKIKAIRKEREETEKNHPRLKDELFDLRIAVSIIPKVTLIQQLKDLEDEVCRRERLSANHWHLRSHSLWLKLGDAPSNYFFKLVTAKCIRESIKVLALYG